MSDGIQTKAWYQFGGLKGFEPGYLVLTPDGKLMFVGPDGPRFEAPLTDVASVKFPRHWFDGGCKLTIGGQQHRVDFVRPNGAADVRLELLDQVGWGGPGGAVAFDALQAVQKVRDIGSGREAGKRWKQVLTSGGALEADAPEQSAQSFAAGWYADPQGEARLRWWDGAQWTAHVAQ